MSKILVLQGPPASGKTTCARGLVKNNKEWVIVSRDSIRESRGDYWIPEQENYISDIEELQIRSAIKYGLNVIIDATNLNPKTIEKWNNLASELKCQIEYREFYIPFKEALERDKNRERSVGEKVLKRFYKQYYLDKYLDETKNTDNRKILAPNFNLQDCIICDIDGTLSIMHDRNPYDLTKVINDHCDARLQHLLNTIKYYLKDQVQIIFFSGREATEQCYQDTLKWLSQYINFPIQLYMRSEGDYRPDEVIKQELYNTFIKRREKSNDK